MWTDLMLDRVIEDAALCRGFAHVFGRTPTDVHVVGAVSPKSPLVPILVERRHLRGDFPLALSVALEGELQSRVSAPTDEQSTIARLSALWQCSCLFSDDSPNPYTWLLMRPTGVLEAVTVDADRLDNDDAFVISRVDRVVRHVPVAV